MGYGVIGSPAGSGPVSLGSSPSTPAVAVRRVPVAAGRLLRFLAPLCSGLARRPLKAVARVRIPSGLQRRDPSDLETGRRGLVISETGISGRTPAAANRMFHSPARDSALAFEDRPIRASPAGGGVRQPPPSSLRSWTVKRPSRRLFTGHLDPVATILVVSTRHDRRWWNRPLASRYWHAGTP